MDTSPITFRCPEELMKQVTARAKAFGINRTDYIIGVLKEDVRHQRKRMMLVAEDPPAYETHPAHPVKKNG
jgi:hypothetical protein